MTRYCHPAFGCDCAIDAGIATAALALMRSWGKDWMTTLADSVEVDRRVVEDWNALVAACDAALPEDEENAWQPER